MTYANWEDLLCSTRPQGPIMTVLVFDAPLWREWQLGFDRLNSYEAATQYGN